MSSSNDINELAVNHKHNVGMPSSFGSTGRKKQQNTIDLCLFGKDRQYIPHSLESNVGDCSNTGNHTVDIQNLRRLASQGIPDMGCHRAVVWRLLLGYLPYEVSEWEEVLQTQRSSYRSLVEELFAAIPEKAQKKPDNRESSGITNTEDHEQPSNGDQAIIDETSITSDTRLNQTDEKEIEEVVELAEKLDIDNSSEKENESNTNIEDEHYKNATEDSSEMPQNKLEGMKTADKSEDSPAQTNNSLEEKRPSNDNGDLNDDISTMKSNSSQPPSAPKLNEEAIERDENSALLDEIRKDVVRTHPSFHFFLEPEDNLGQQRYAAIERILFVWAKLNKGVRYVQGMNEIAGTIYFVLANDSNEKWANEAEADAYFLFNTLMSEMRDVFVPDLDEADTGIQGRISYFITLLSLHDPEVKCHLDDIGIDATFYCIRWLTTLLSREFMLPDTIRIWDSMFASTHKDNFLRYVCVTMVMVIRDKLLHNDFSHCLRLLQSYPPTNIDRLLESSRALWIYESQVTLACYKGGIRLQTALKSLTPPPAIIMAYGLADGIAQNKSFDTQSLLPKARSSARAYLNSINAIGTSMVNPKEGLNSSKKKFFGGGAKSFFSQMTGYVSESSLTNLEGESMNQNNA